uniref:Uncharacterized protein n=1 Tax=Echeneis naucrates TaxID=173247 RepID=A0A665TR93_ECHNA
IQRQTETNNHSHSQKPTQDVTPVGDRLLSTEEQVTLITESMSVTSTDQEKLLLLNKNTELRRVNKEVCDLQVCYLLFPFGLQSAKEYYEQALMQELKKNQELQEYIRLLESRMQDPERPCTAAKQVLEAIRRQTAPPSGSSVLLGSVPTNICSSQSKPYPLVLSHCHIHVMYQQTQIYEAEYQTEHNDHKHTLQENHRLRRKREEMRQQVALLQEQLKIYEDDFRRERSDKQMLQRLLLKKTPPNRDPVLIHRCNNEEQPQGGDKRTQSREKRKHHHPLCPKHRNREKESD